MLLKQKLQKVQAMQAHAQRHRNDPYCSTSHCAYCPMFSFSRAYTDFMNSSIHQFIKHAFT